MTEKREWWSDDLIDAVWDAYNMQVYYADEDERLDSIYAIIAVVEDMQAEHGINIVGTAIADHITRLNRAEAAIRQVRKVTKFVPIARKHDTEKLAWYAGWNDAIDAVYRAMDGNSDE